MSDDSQHQKPGNHDERMGVHGGDDGAARTSSQNGRAKVAIKRKHTPGFNFTADDVTRKKTVITESIKNQTLKKQQGISFVVKVVLFLLLIIIILVVVVLLYQFCRQLDRSDRNFREEEFIVQKEQLIDRKRHQRRNNSHVSSPKSAQRIPVKNVEREKNNQ